MRKILILGCLLLSIGITPLHSQDTPWQATFLYFGGDFNDEKLLGVLTVTADGQVEEAPLSEPVEISFQDSSTGASYTYRISADHRYLVASLNDPFNQTVSPRVLDLQHPEAGWQVLFALESESYNVGTFIGNSSLVPIATTTDDFDTASIILVDAATPGAEPLAAYNIEDTYYAIFLDEWDATGIAFFGVGIGDGPLGGRIGILDVDTGEIQITDEVYYFYDTQRLAGTGEFLFNNFAPFTGAANSEFRPHPNAIEYYPSGNFISWTAPLEDHPVVFADLIEPGSPRAHWVMDGGAIYVEFDHTYTKVLVYRDGTQITLPGDQMYFTEGTPDGWIAFSANDGGLYAATIQDGQPVYSRLHVGYGYISLARSPLGASITEQTFAPDTQPYRIGGDCSTWNPEIGGHYTEASGGYIMMKYPISTSPTGDPITPVQTGELVAGEPFEVLDGPVCVEDGARWQVSDGFNIGWVGDSGFVPTDLPMPPIPAGFGDCGDFVSRISVYQGAALAKDSVDFYAIPSFEGDPQGTVKADDEQFYVNEGPVCSEGTVWWGYFTFTAENERIRGWIPEGDENGYWLVPREDDFQ